MKKLSVLLEAMGMTIIVTIVGVLVYLFMYTLASLFVLWVADVLLGTSICYFNNAFFCAVVLFVINILFMNRGGVRNG